MTLGKVSPGSESRGERTGKVYDLVGEAVGMSGPTYKRAKAVVREAERGDPVAVEALEEMDATGKVTPAYAKVTERANGSRGTTRDGSWKRTPEHLVGNIIDKALGTVAALEHVETTAAITSQYAPLSEWDKNLTDIIVPLNRLRGEIRKVLSDG